ncbi:MAG: A/G-specific adenine glycosylase [Thermaerobacter sp.]|nr:A/G-specific adenine glycosylase [Thermaerobacter sp.]
MKYRAFIDETPLRVFQDGILTWYQSFGRDLPWRHTRNPYHILVSEIMLHQTTVKTVIPVYLAFLDRFPTIRHVFDAPLDDVKRITDPLGYKIRGQWLHAIAGVVVRRYGGEWPDTMEGLLDLPGVGRYTAGAILSFAFGHDAPIVDTNVKRLLGRYFGVDYQDPRAETRHHLWALSEAVIPFGHGPTFNQALLDMGAVICTARRPACLICPVAAACRQLQGGGEGRAAETAAPYLLTGREH